MTNFVEKKTSQIFYLPNLDISTRTYEQDKSDQKLQFPTWSRSPSALHRSWPGGPWECVVSASVSGPLSPDQLWSAKTQEEVWAVTLTQTFGTTNRHHCGLPGSKLNNRPHCLMVEQILVNNLGMLTDWGLTPNAFCDTSSSIWRHCSKTGWIDNICTQVAHSL